MTQLAQHPAYLQIEDRLDVVGQKYRVQRMLRGGLLFLTTALAASWAAAGAVSAFSRDGHVAPGLVYTIGALWLATILAALVAWVIRPMLLRPRAIEVARLVESRMDGLHNGLTNAILLAEKDDVAGNPWSANIVDEIAAATGGKPIGDVVRLSDLKTLAVRCGLVLLPMAVTFALFPNAFGHGLKQMMQPSAFVPTQGAAEIVSVEPGNATRVAGQPLEVLVTAKAPADASARIVFDTQFPAAAMQPIGGEEGGVVRFAYRVDHVDETLKYRVEVAGTQSEWYTLSVVRQIKLTDCSLTVTPPAYTKQDRRTIAIKPDAPNESPITIAQGSEVTFNATVDVPIAGAMLQTNVPNSQPLALTRVAKTERFTGKLTILDDTTLSMLVTDSSGTVAATLPASPIVINCTKDAGPKIDMKWPTADTVVAPDAELKLSAILRDDYGVTSARVLLAQGPDATLSPVESRNFKLGNGNTAEAQHELAVTLKVDPAFRKHGQSVRVQVEAVDNRDLTAYAPDLGPQTSSSTVMEIKFRDKELSAAERKEQIDKLRQILQAMLKKQQDLHARTVAMKDGDVAIAKTVQQGQTELRDEMTKTADTFAFDESNEVIKRTLQVLVLNPAKDAIDLSAAYQTEPAAKEQAKLGKEIQSRQRRIITTLESLLAMLNHSPEPTTQPAEKRAGDLEAKTDAYKKLAEDLKKYMEEQRKILDQTANLAKKPVDDWSDKDKKLAEELAMSQEKLDAFMQEKVGDFSKLAEQDMSNASLLKELMELYSEVTMAKDALKKQAMEIAVPLEEMGLELAKEIESNLEKWLMDEPDRIKWSQEDPTSKTDTPMAELPKELEDMIGELMEEQEDLFEDMEDANANWTDSLDKGAGWDAADGPIANMSAKGVTGNQLPNNNEMGGRAGEGRSGKSQGEFVEETATGKGGRNTPTRLDPTPFQQGQVKDESKDPVGGATGGGKVSGQGGQGLEGPVPPKIQEEMKRLASKQAELRNKAERLNLQYQLGRYDNFNLLRSAALMRRVENDLNANRYSNALRRRDVLIDSMDTSQLLLGGRVHVQEDTSPTMSQKTQQDLHDAMKGDLPPAWQEALKQYYEKLGQQ
jgi:hypothetical protein